jgi:glycosyltransferase involved in cell wall biosynthesis
MKVLVLSHKPPYPIVDGGCLAMSRFIIDLQGVKQIKEIDYVTLSTHKHPFIPAAFDQATTDKVTFQGIPIDTKIKLIPALVSLLSNKSYHTKRFYHSHVAQILLARLNSKKYDVIIFESLYAAIYTPIIRSVFKGKICYRSHNLEFRIWSDLARNERNPLKAWYIRQLAKTLKTEEINTWNQVNLILPISKNDADFMKEFTKTTVRYLPSSMPDNKRDVNKSIQRVCFLGSFDWEPNLEAVKWFIDTILPIIALDFPQIEFHIAGRKSTEIPIEYRKSSVVIHGFVEDPLQFIAENGIFVAGLQSGSGIKMKILEAMSIGAPCVLTNKAAEGLTVESIMPVHNNTESFISDIRELLNNENQRSVRGELGKQFIQANFSTELVNKILEEQFRPSI